MANAPQPWQHRFALVNGVRLHFVEAGSGPLVVLLHGFPEFWYSWHHQIPVLAVEGFRVIAPDLRGYNESDKPSGVHNYRLELLVEDIAALIEHAGVERAHVVGHDWGGVIAWVLAMRHPQRVDRLVILNAPHPAAFRREMANPAQWLRSWYILFFQLPGLPEWFLEFRDQLFLDQILRNQPVNHKAFTPEDIDRYKRAMNHPGARTATVNYYRAALRYAKEARALVRPLPLPTLLIWGEQDPYLGIRLTQELQAWVGNLRIERLADASHWVQNDAPQRVNQLLLEFLRVR